LVRASPTGGHGQIYGFRHDVCACVQSTSGICDGVDECRRAVRRQVSYGPDAIKFVATGGVLSDIKAGLDQQFTDDEIRSIIEAAHRLGRRVAAHAHGATGINAALEAGVDSIEHGSFTRGDVVTVQSRRSEKKGYPRRPLPSLTDHGSRSRFSHLPHMSNRRHRE